MFRYKILILAVALLATASTSFAITDEEVFRNFPFTFLNPGARSGAMGGAFIALADDATAAEANPAGLTILTKPEVSFEYRHTEVDEEELNQIVNIPPELGVFVATANAINEQDQPSFASVVFPAGNWTFGFSRQEFVKLDAVAIEAALIQVPGLGDINVDALGAVEQDIVNWNFAVGVKLSDSFSLGGTLRYSQLDWQNEIVNLFTLVFPGDTEPTTVPGSTTSIDDSDNGFGFNIGALWKSKHASFGAVYKRNPKFEVTEVEEGLLIDAGQIEFTNTLKVPDTFGGGVAIKPNDTITVTADVVYIRYEDLLENFQAGHNIFTLGYTNDDLNYVIDNGIDYHVGTEFIAFAGTVPIALRAGYYRRATSSLVLESAPGALALDQVILPLIFAERDDTNHFTFGNGFVFGSHFQLDWAVDVSNLDDTFVLSSVVRF